MKPEHKCHPTQGTSSQNRVIPNPTIYLPILDELKNLGFGGMRRNI
jgi:hypothetical protein